MHFGNSSIIFADNMDTEIGLPTWHVDVEPVSLCFTSPPYWNFIDYNGTRGVGTEVSYEEYLHSMFSVFREVERILIPGGRLVVNVSNMNARRKIEGECFVYPIVADTIGILSDIGLRFFDEVIWHKSDANFGALGGMLFGSYPYPPTPKILTSTFENLLIYQKEGKRQVDKSVKEESKLTKEEWLEYTKGIWKIRAERDKTHPASFPMALVERVIRLYSFVGDMVLDPFAGSGTTPITADIWGRVGKGYELCTDYQESVKTKLFALHPDYKTQQEMF